MSNHTTTHPMVSDVLMLLTEDDEPIRTAERAVALAEASGFCILPRRPDNGDGMWLCDVAAEIHATLVECGWVGIENGPFSADAEWPD
jgi:hypothetical protein